MVLVKNALKQGFVLYLFARCHLARQGDSSDKGSNNVGSKPRLVRLTSVEKDTRSILQIHLELSSKCGNARIVETLHGNTAGNVLMHGLKYVGDFRWLDCSNQCFLLFKPDLHRLGKDFWSGCKALQSSLTCAKSVSSC